MVQKIVYRFNAEALEACRSHHYISRYRSAMSFRAKYAQVRAIKPIVQSGLAVLDEMAFRQLIAVCYDLLCSGAVDVNHLLSLTPTGKRGLEFGKALQLWPLFWNGRDKPRAYGKTISAIEFSYVLCFPYTYIAGVGDRLLPYLFDALVSWSTTKYDQIHPLTSDLVRQAMVRYTNSMVYDFCTASPEAENLLSMYAKSSKLTTCRAGIVRCLTKYPKDCTNVVTVMRHIAKNDPDPKIREIAKLSVKSY